MLYSPFNNFSVRLQHVLWLIAQQSDQSPHCLSSFGHTMYAKTTPCSNFEDNCSCPNIYNSFSKCKQSHAPHFKIKVIQQVWVQVMRFCSVIGLGMPSCPKVFLSYPKAPPSCLNFHFHIITSCEASQVLLVGGHVFFLGDLPFSPHLWLTWLKMIIILTGRKTQMKK